MKYGVTLDVGSKNEHTVKIEQDIRTIKERFSNICSSLPHPCLPSWMVGGLIALCVIWMNAIPPKKSVLAIYLPQTIVTGTTFDFKLHCRTAFRDYAKFRDNPEPTIMRKSSK